MSNEEKIFCKNYLNKSFKSEDNLGFKSQINVIIYFQIKLFKDEENFMEKLHNHLSMILKIFSQLFIINYVFIEQ